MSSEQRPGHESWRPERETKSQREWQPGQQKKQRSTFVLFASTILLGEAFVIVFFGLMLYGLYQEDGGLWFFIGSLVLALLTGYVSRLVAKPIGVPLGWAVQVLLIASGFLQPFGFFIGIAFALAWWYAVVKGKQIDRDNAQRAAEQEAWEREHGVEADNDSV